MTPDEITQAVEEARAFMATAYDYRHITAAAMERIASAFLAIVDATPIDLPQGTPIGDGWHVAVARIDRANAMTAIEALDGTRFPAARGHYWVRFGDAAQWSTARWDGERWTYLGNDQEYTPKQSSITEWRGPLKEPG